MKNRFFYGWVVAAASGIGIASSVMIFIPATIGILAANLHKSFGWSLPQIMYAPMVATCATILVAPFLGALVDRIGAKRVIGISFLLEALLIASFSFVNDNIWLFYARYGLLALLATGTTTVPFARIISRWFEKRRGIALGIALAFTGIGGAIWSLAVQFLIVHVGWRNSFLCEAAFIAVIVMPLLLLVLREDPESMGFNVDGAPLDVTRRPAVQIEKTGMTLREATKTRNFWMVAVAFFIVPFPIQSILMILVPMLLSQGITPQTAAAIQASLWIAMVAGRLGSGWLVDRLFAPRVAAGLVLPAIIGISMFSVGVNGGLAFLAAMLVGISNGSEGNILPYITGRYFGLKHYTSIYGTFFSCYALGSGFGPVLTAIMVGHLGGYGKALWVLLACLAVGAFILLVFRAYPTATPKPIAPKGQTQAA